MSVIEFYVSENYWKTPLINNIFYLQCKRISLFKFQWSYFNPAEPESEAKETPKVLKNDETCLVGRTAFIYGSICSEWNTCR